MLLVEKTDIILTFNWHLRMQIFSFNTKYIVPFIRKFVLGLRETTYFIDLSYYKYILLNILILLNLILKKKGKICFINFHADSEISGQFSKFTDYYISISLERIVGNFQESWKSSVDMPTLLILVITNMSIASRIMRILKKMEIPGIVLLNTKKNVEFLNYSYIFPIVGLNLFIINLYLDLISFLIIYYKYKWNIAK